MAEEDASATAAPAPAEFTRNLRCCVTCRLVKTLDQFYEEGCENCPFLEMVEDRERIDDCTTTEFQVNTQHYQPEHVAGSNHSKTSYSNFNFSS